MFYLIIDVLGFYLVLIGTWRLATATRRPPMGSQLWEYGKEEQTYFPLKDLISPHKVISWMFKTILSFNKPGRLTGAVIVQKQFNWGLFWILLGLIIEFSCGLMK